MSAEERETRQLVALHHVGDFPGLRVVAANAVAAELGFMDIGVTRCARGTNAVEFQLLMAAGAICNPVLAVEREACLRVVKGRIRTHLPRIGGMTRLTRYIELAMRRGLGPESRRCDDEKHHDKRNASDHLAPR